MGSEEYVGKRALVGITYRETDGTVIERKQFHGTITGVAENGMLLLERSDGQGEVKIPAQLDPAKPGEYTLASTGEVVVDPDYMAVWSVIKHPPPDISENE